VIRRWIIPDLIALAVLAAILIVWPDPVVAAVLIVTAVLMLISRRW